jgi:UDP-N-acetylglucosamine acyltransferase
MPKIHPTALVDPKACLDDDVCIGPYTTVGPRVVIGAGSVVASQFVITGDTTIGCGNRIFQFSSIGEIPQDKKYQGEDTILVIGDNNTIREACSIHIGTVQDRGETRIGHDNWIMGNVHIAHDCVLGNHIIIANYTGLAGHVHIDDWVVLGGQSGIYQCVHMGAHSMSAFQSHVGQSVPPFITVGGNPLSVLMVNQEGLKRRGYTRERIANIKTIYRLLYRQGLTLEKAIQAISNISTEDPKEQEDISCMLHFLQSNQGGMAR